MTLSEKQPHFPVISVLVSLNLLSLNNWPPAAVFTGKYVMVMGVIQAISPEPVIRAVKMADLSELAALHRRMWKLEVEDLQQLLAWMHRLLDEMLPFLVAGRPAPFMRVQLGMQYWSDTWQMEKKETSHHWTAHFPRCQAPDPEVWRWSDERNQYLLCEVWRLNNRSYILLGSCSKQGESFRDDMELYGLLQDL